MEHAKIFSATLGLSYPWQITDVALSKGEKRLDITVHYSLDGSMSCPICGAEVKFLPPETELWHHHDFFRYSTFLHAFVPRIQCRCGVCHLERPWSRTGSRFALVPGP